MKVADESKRRQTESFQLSEKKFNRTSEMSMKDSCLIPIVGEEKSINRMIELLLVPDRNFYIKKSHIRGKPQLSLDLKIIKENFVML